MSEIIKIKCPFCGVVLSVKHQPGIETKSLTCPVCKNKNPFSQFKIVSPHVEEDDRTFYPEDHGLSGDRDEHTHYTDNDDTVGFFNQNFTLGKIIDIGTGRSYQLKPGRNVIGRKAHKSEAVFQIDTGANRAMSREHIVIEVKKVAAKGFVHYISLFKEKVNETKVGNEPLLYGDCIVLNHGTIINLPDATLRFEIPDDEGTEI